MNAPTRKENQMSKGTAEDILPTLIGVLNQACQFAVVKGKFFCDDFSLSAYEEGFEVLEIEGYAKKIKRGKYRGKWLLSWEVK